MVAFPSGVTSQQPAELCRGENGWYVEEQIKTAEPLGFVLVPRTLLLKLMCAAEIAAFSNYYWKYALGVIVIYI